MTRPLHIWIDPALAGTESEVAWAWKYLLSAAGYAWARVADQASADILHSTDRRTDTGASATLTMLADPIRWASPGAVQLADIHQVAEPGEHPDWHLPRYTDETAGRQPLEASPTGSWRSNRDLLFDLFWFLTRQGERTRPRGRHGQIDLTDSPLAANGALRRAVASGIATRIERLLAPRHGALTTPRWPGGHRAAASASHDVDYPEVIRWLEPARILRRNGWRGIPAALEVARGRRTHWHFESWVAAERALRTRSAFFFVPRQGSLHEYATGTPDPFYDIDAPRFATAFRQLADAGAEVGLHASYRAYADARRFRAELDHLTAASGQEIEGCRHHYWHLDPEEPERTLLIHELAGLRYDASLCHERHLGWRAGSTLPFFPYIAAERRAISTLQLPTGWMDDQLFGYRHLNPGPPEAQLAGLLDTVLAQGGLMLVDVHDYVFDDVLFPGWARTYLDFWATLAADSSIWIATPREVAAHWKRRYHELEAQSAGL